MIRPASRRQIVVLKIGGSLITDRRRYRVPRFRVIAMIARAVAEWRAQRPIDVVLIVGGGGFGHNVVHRHGIDMVGAHKRPSEVFELTTSLFELKVLLARALGRQDVPCIPLQESTLFVERDGVPELTDARAIEACFTAGYLPLLSGGLVAGDRVGFRPISSDRLALPLCSAFGVARFGILTDQPGVMRGSEVIRRIRPPQFKHILSEIAPSNKLDVSDGMRGKLAAAIELAHSRVETVICSGKYLDGPALASIFSPRPPGTLVIARHDRARSTR